MNVITPNPTPFKPEAPQPLLREIAKGNPYPVDALGSLQDVVAAVHDKTQAPIAIAAQSALAIASLAVQGFADVETLAGQAPCSIFCLTIAQSGERKSACDKLLMRAVREFEADRAAGYRQDFIAHETDLKLWEMRRSQLLKEAATGKGDKAIAAKADLNALSAPPEPPLVPILTASEPTFPGLVKLFRTGRPSLGLFTDEAGAFVGGHSMNSDNKLATVAGLSSLWDGSPINRTRSEDGASTIHGRRLASHLMCQPVAALPMLADPVVSQQGFLARFLIAQPDSAIGTRTRRGFDPASDVSISRFGAKIRTVLETSLPIREGSRNELEPRLLSLSADASELLRQYYENTEIEQAHDGQLAHVRPYASKSAEQAARIAGVLTLWDDLNAVEVKANTMALGITLAQFYLSEASRLADAAVVSMEVERAEMLRVWLLDKWHEPEILPREILQYGPSSLRESPKMKAAMSLLIEHGWLARMPEGTLVRGSNRKEVYQIVKSQNVV